LRMQARRSGRLQRARCGSRCWTETPRTLQEDEAGKFSLEFSYYSS
jgi:hypothetical protein